MPQSEVQELRSDRSQDSPLLDRGARVLTELLAPAVIAGVMPLIVAGIATRSVAKTLIWGSATLFFTAAVPYFVIWLGVSKGRLTDRHVGVRQQRRGPIVAGFASVLVGVVALSALSAPRDLVVLAVVLLGVIVAVGSVNIAFWKVSAHAAVAAASSMVLIIMIGSWALPTILLVAAVGWSRVRVRDHTPAQVIVGAGAGAIIAASVLTIVAAFG